MAVSHIFLISVFINMLIFDKLTQDKIRMIEGLVVGVRGALTRQKFDPHRFYDVVIAHGSRRRVRHCVCQMVGDPHSLGAYSLSSSS